MKFKQIDGQNQRIEQISTSHLVVGIDMAQEIHVAHVIRLQNGSASRPRKLSVGFCHTNNIEKND